MARKRANNVKNRQKKHFQQAFVLMFFMSLSPQKTVLVAGDWKKILTLPTENSSTCWHKFSVLLPLCLSKQLRAYVYRTTYSLNLAASESHHRWRDQTQARPQVTQAHRHSKARCNRDDLRAVCQSSPRSRKRYCFRDAPQRRLDNISKTPRPCRIESCIANKPRNTWCIWL